VTSRGWEASAAGYLTNEWQIIASYAYTHARITKTKNPIQLNAELQITPQHAFSVWTTYDLTKDFQVGAGAFYQSSVWGDMQSMAPYTVANTAFVPDWWRFDLMAAYKINPKVTLQFNIYNLMDKLYYESAYTNWAVPAPSRMFALTLRGHT
jgi:catecholate siderophore receptor